MRPQAACARIVVVSTRVSQVTPENVRHSPRNGFTAYNALSPATGFFATVACGCFRKLDASIGASGPRDFAVRINAIRQRRFSVHRIPPRVRDDREPPLCVGRDGGGYEGDLRERGRGNIFREGAGQANH